MMKTLMLMALCGLAAGTAVFILALPRGATALPDPYQGMSTDTNFPGDPATLVKMRDESDLRGMRAHGWMLWSKLNREMPDGKPIWTTWYLAETILDPHPDVASLDVPTVTGGAPAADGAPAIRFSPPAQFRPDNAEEGGGAEPLSDTSHITAEAIGVEKFPARVTVLYNREGRNHILHPDNRYDAPQTFNDLNIKFQQAGTPARERRLEEFPPTTVVIKAVWRIVSPTHTTALAVWDTGSESDPKPDPARSYPPAEWTRSVIVDPTRDVIPAGEEAEAFDREIPPQLKRGRVVSAASFFKFTINSQQARDAGNGAQAGDLALLVGMHVMTKELKDWVWATYWWHDRPNEGEFGFDRPLTLPVSDRWKNYRMEVAFSAETPVAYDGGAHICFNPWLEANDRAGVTSNCMACHQRAAMSWALDGTLMRRSQLPVRGMLKPGDPEFDFFFSDKIQTDYLWSIPELVSKK